MTGAPGCLPASPGLVSSLDLGHSSVAVCSPVREYQVRGCDDVFPQVEAGKDATLPNWAACYP